ncbi:hypothetical protein FSC02_10700 [Acinetobacter indicus]|uniref:hypothetical protein n=1 Tax=Acinetobacter indicus TaxID=756892 RepID=UPI0013B07EE5|nr:hypothetical protein [Acinetobacter indicus]QIC79560.1 hypothetical protein FSC02_10700 [Acinetobacter indicus]
MLIDFRQQQQARFEQVAQRLQQAAAEGLHFDSVADFYQSGWLEQFPAGIRWSVTGLDDGAEQFYAWIDYLDCFVRIDAGEMLRIEYGRHQNNPTIFSQ